MWRLYSTQHRLRFRARQVKLTLERVLGKKSKLRENRDTLERERAKVAHISIVRVGCELS